MTHEIPEISPAEIQARQEALDKQGLEDAKKLLAEDPDRGAKIKEELTYHAKGEPIKPNQVRTLLSSGNYQMAAVAEQMIAEENNKFAAEANMSPEDYAWYLAKAQEHLDTHKEESAEQAVARLKDTGRNFEASVMERLV